MKNVLITGAASGLGSVIINDLLAVGYTVTGAMHDAAGRNRRLKNKYLM